MPHLKPEITLDENRQNLCAMDMEVEEMYVHVGCWQVRKLARRMALIVRACPYKTHKAARYRT